MRRRADSIAPAQDAPAGQARIAPLRHQDVPRQARIAHPRPRSGTVVPRIVGSDCGQAQRVMGVALMPRRSQDARIPPSPRPTSNPADLGDHGAVPATPPRNPIATPGVPP
jgi:hypothetical protein